MKRFILSLGVGFLLNNVVSTLIATTVLNPLLNPMFNGTVRTEEQGLVFPSLLGGYFLLTLFMVLGFPYFHLNRGWFVKGTVWGLLVGGATFISGHLVVAGWSIIPWLPMMLSGVLDTLAPIATGIIIAYFYRNETGA